MKAIKTAAEQFADEIKGKAHVICGGLKGLAKPMGCSAATVYTRIKAPQTITIEELREIRRTVGISQEDMAALIKPML